MWKQKISLLYCGGVRRREHLRTIYEQYGKCYWVMRQKRKMYNCMTYNTGSNILLKPWQKKSVTGAPSKVRSPLLSYNDQLRELCPDFVHAGANAVSVSAVTFFQGKKSESGQQTSVFTGLWLMTVANCSLVWTMSLIWFLMVHGYLHLTRASLHSLWTLACS